MDTDMASVFWFVVPGIVVPALFTILAFWSPNRRQVLRWGKACDVTITPANQEQIRSHLARVRRYRSVASLPFWWLAFIRGVDAEFPPALATPAIAMAAYICGALLAELTAPLTRPDGVRHAALVPRLVRDYRPNWVRTLTLSLLAIAVACVVLRVTVVDDARRLTYSLPLTLALVVIVSVVAKIAARRIVERPQRDTEPDLLAADEGLKAAAVSMTVGAELLAAMVAAGVAAASSVPAETGAWAWLLIPWMLVLQWASIGVLALIVRQETLGYGRRYLQQPVAVPA